MSRLLNDAIFRETTAKAGLAATEHLAWDESNKLIEAFIQTSLPSAPAASPLSKSSNPVVTVVIPVYNGGSMLKAVVESCLKQDLDEEFEMLLIDSSSNDGCLEALPQDERIRLHRIRKEDFGHGRTRNLGVELARGEYVAFITQDAIPANRMWLMNLIAPLQNDPGVAGVSVATWPTRIMDNSRPMTWTCTSIVGFLEVIVNQSNWMLIVRRPGRCLNP